MRAFASSRPCPVKKSVFRLPIRVTNGGGQHRRRGEARMAGLISESSSEAGANNNEEASDLAYMRLALNQAHAAADLGEVPVGAGVS